MKFRNAKGELVEAPKDLSVIVANLEDGRIVWSRTKKGNVHQVRYALQATPFGTIEEAAKEMAECIIHHARCEGRLD